MEFKKARKVYPLDGMVIGVLFEGGEFKSTIWNLLPANGLFLMRSATETCLNLPGWKPADTVLYGTKT